jgi:tetratricopeptide (TPR) repeat protein
LHDALANSDFARALALYRRGRLAEAEQACEAILVRRPDRADVLHLLGIMALQTGRPRRAVDLIGRSLSHAPGNAGAHYNHGLALAAIDDMERALTAYDNAIALRPDHAAAFNNRGNALRALRRPEEAVRCYDRAIAQRRDDPEPHNNRGVALMDLGRAPDALSSFDAALALRPDHADAHLNRGNCLKFLGRNDEAQDSYDRAIALAPRLVPAHHEKGKLSRDAGRDAEALACFDAAIALDPNNAEAHFDRATVLAGLGRAEDALASYDRAIALRPDYVAAHNNRGNALRDLDRHQEAFDSFAQAIALNPLLVEAHSNQGAALDDLGRFDDALSCYDRAISLRPDHAPAHNNKGAVQIELGSHEDALKCFDTALALRPNFAEARFNKGVCLLAMGDFEYGWREFAWHRRANVPSTTERDHAGSPWLGDVPVSGKTILVQSEAGFGDDIQFCRYVPMLARQARVVLEVPRPLRRLLAGLAGVSQIIATDEPTPPFDLWTPMMSLPLAFGTRLDSIPATIPYLTAAPAQADAWKRRLASLPGLKVGLVWAGSSRAGFRALDRRRSVTLRHFAPLAAVPGVCFVSLQKGESATQAGHPIDGMMVHDWTAELSDFADTAALISALDLVISVDTAVVHLAGAMGKPVWVLNRYDQCWRWLRNRTDSPWYPTARLFRQATQGDWAGVLREVAKELQGIRRGGLPASPRE